MKKILLPLMALVITTLNMQAQPPADSTPTYPQGATYTHSSGTANASTKGIVIQDGKKVVKK